MAHITSDLAVADTRPTSPITTASSTPFGVRVAHTDTSNVTTEWFTTLADRAAWITQANNLSIEPRPLIRVTDDDEHGCLLNERDVICLDALAAQAREQRARQGYGTPPADTGSRQSSCALSGLLRPRSSLTSPPLWPVKATRSSRRSET